MTINSTGFVGYVNLMDSAASITAGSSLAGLPVFNLVNDQLSKVWRTVNGVTETYILIDLGAAYDIDVVALVATNLNTDATMRVRMSLSNPAATGSLVYDVESNAYVDEFVGMAVRLTTEQVNARYIRIDINNAGLSYLQVGRLVIQTAWRFTYGPEANLDEEWVDASSQFQTEGGRRWVYVRPALRRIAGTLPAITEAEYRAKGRVVSRNLASKVSTLFCADTADLTELGSKAIWGLFERGMPMKVRNRTPTEIYYTATFSLMEQA
jgi:hypothetical protein